MDGMLALTIVCIVFAIGDFISDKTHAVVPVLLFASVSFLVLFWSGLVPTTLFDDAGLIAISSMMTGLFIVNMGTLLDLKQFIEQWKVVVLGLAIVIVGGILMFFVARPILGNNFAVALVGPITGGWVSAVVVNDAIKALGAPESLQLAGVLATIIVAVQGIIGYPWPLCSCGRKPVGWFGAIMPVPSSGPAPSLKTSLRRKPFPQKRS